MTVEDMLAVDMDKIIIQGFWSGRGESKLEAIYYRDERKLGREVVASVADALLNGEALYGFTIETTEIEER